MKIPKPGDIKFNSLHAILPSEKKSCALDYENNRKVTINDFVLMKVLAAGAYGKVILSRKKNTKDLFAIKVLEIQKMRAKNCEETIMNEKMILSELNTDFITRGVYTFKSNKYLYMVMEFMKGGDMENLLKEAGYLD
jgi:serine/threonine protein kinase